MPGVVMKSMSSPSSLKNPRSRAASTGKSCTAFMIATCGFLATGGLRTASCTGMSFLLPMSIWCLSHQAVGASREQILHSNRFREDFLLEGGGDHLLEGAAVRFDSVGQGIAAGDLHHAPVHPVDGGRLFAFPRLQALDIKALRLGECAEEVRPQVGARFENLVPHDHQVVD